MNLHEEQKKVQKAMNTTLSGLQEDPWLTQRVLANAKGEGPVKRKISLALVLSITAILVVMGTAYALFSSQVAEFFGRHWGHDYGDWLQGGRIAQIGETVTLGGVDFTLDEVVYRDRGIYGVGTARAANKKDVLVPMDVVDGWELEAVMQGDEAQALIRRAGETGGRLLSIDCWPERIGVDDGSMINAGDVGVYNLRNEDGSITFSFETGGYALEDGTTYQLELSIDVDEWTEAGMVDNDPVESRTWTVSFRPVIMTATAAPERPVPVPAKAVSRDGYAILVPASYRETGTLPVYKAVENDFMATMQPEWFDRSGIAERKEAKKDVSLTFNDHAELSYSAEAVWYAEYTDELFDYNRKERETYTPDIEPMMLPKRALSQDIAQMAGQVHSGYEDFTKGVTFEHDRLTHLSLEDAMGTAEALFEKMGLHGYELAWKLDMSLDRIRTLGEAYNRFWFEGGGYSNAPRQDFSAATEEDEGYFLYYTPLGVDQISDGRQQITLFITGRGIVYANIVSTYVRAEAVYTPESLILPEEAAARLYAEVAMSRDEIKVKSVERAALTYMAVRAENKQDGMVFAPVWQILFREEGRGEEYLSWAEFNAVNGTMIDATFR
ncbi:MAG: DUF4179 domain-containing protein [Clostridia bacterium]|nr:DUF4179 domain-containing protein [Clostridia bacterium]